MLNKLNYILDIGSSKLSLIAFSPYAGKMRIVAQDDILYDGYMEGEFLSEDDLEDVLSQLLSKMMTKMRKPITSLTVGVPSEFCICVCKRISRSFTDLHKVNKQDIEALYQDNLNFGDSEDYMVVNYSPMQFLLDDNLKTLTPEGKRCTSLVLDASFVLGKKSILNLLYSKLKDLGVENVDFVSTALAQAANCLDQNLPNQQIAVVDVGHISTSVCVLKGEGLALLSSFSMGGGHISSDIMQILGMSFKDAELIKRKVILTVESTKNEYYEVCLNGNLIKAPINMTNQIVKSRIELISKVIAEILSVDDLFKNVDIYLTGDGIANFKGAKNILKKYTGLNVHDYKIPFDNSVNKYQTSKTGLVQLVGVLK